MTMCTCEFYGMPSDWAKWATQALVVISSAVQIGVSVWKMPGRVTHLVAQGAVVVPHAICAFFGTFAPLFVTVITDVVPNPKRNCLLTDHIGYMMLAVVPSVALNLFNLEAKCLLQNLQDGTRYSSTASSGAFGTMRAAVILVHVSAAMAFLTWARLACGKLAVFFAASHLLVALCLVCGRSYVGFVLGAAPQAEVSRELSSRRS